MYQVESLRTLVRTRRGMVARPGAPAVSRTVVLLGLVSFFTDVSSEMVAAILPLYVVVGLGLSPLLFGVLDGIYQGGAVMVRVIGGFVGDRWRRHREVAGAGYGLSAVCKLGFLAAGSSWGALSAVVAVDRAGKGIRTAPRDAMISLATPPGQLGIAFGTHRAMDTAGAMLGPLLAFGLLALTPGAFDSIFVVSFCFALVGLAVLLLLVERPAVVPVSVDRPPRTVTVQAALGLLRERRFRILALVACGLGLVTVSDGFIYLALQRNVDFYTGWFPLLYFATALVYMVLAVPLGRLADRTGRAPVLVGGYGLLLLAYGVLLLPDLGLTELLVCLALLGAYYAATDGVLMALGSAILPPELRGTGLAVLATGVGAARLVASVLFGLAWTAAGLHSAVLLYAGALVVAALLAALALRVAGVEEARA